MEGKEDSGLAAAFMERSEGMDELESDYEEMDKAAFADAADEVLGAIRSGNKDDFSASLKNAIKLCMG